MKIMIEDNDTVFAGQVLARISCDTTKTADMPGDLPRVVGFVAGAQVPWEVSTTMLRSARG